MNILIYNLTKLDFMAPCRKIKSLAIKSDVSNKILTIALPAFAIAGCALQRNNLTVAIGKTFTAFCGHEGWVTPTLMISTCLALKYFTSANQKSEDPKLSNPCRTVTWLKDIPKNFVTGVIEVPSSLAFFVPITMIAGLIFKILSIDTSPHSDFLIQLKKASVIDVAVRGPFLEELFFREIVQGSLISSMRLINLVRFYMKKDLIISDEVIQTSSRAFSAITFGLVHSNQDLTQAVVAGVSSYYYETHLYEKNGLSASFGHHFANNFFVFSLIKALEKTKSF